MNHSTTKKFPNNVIIETQRLILRKVVLSDVDGFFRLDSDPEVHRFLGNRPLKTKDDAIKVIRSIQNQYEENGIARLAVILKDRNEFIGWSGIKIETKEVNEHHNYYDLGYRFIRKYWEKGYATESARASLQFGFNKLGVHEIFAAAHIHNYASNHVLQKIGMHFVNQFSYDGDLHYWYKMTHETFLSQHVLTKK